MPLSQFQCPSNTPTAGAANSLEHCLDGCPHRCMPSGILNTIWMQNVTNVHKGDIVTPTSFPRCPRKLKLERTRDYAALPQQLYWAVRGGLYHGWLEHKRPGILTECRLWKQVTFGPEAPYWISGALDHYDYKDKSIEDYKSSADKGTFYLFNDGAKKDHVQQLNIYKWLAEGGLQGNTLEEALDRNDAVHLDVKKLIIHNVYMMMVISTGTTHTEKVTSYKAPNNGKPYRLETTRRQVGQTDRGCPKWEVDIAIPPIPIWTTAQVEAVIVDRAPTLIKMFREPSFMPEGILRDPDNNWECKLCPVKPLCDEIELANSSTLF